MSVTFKAVKTADSKGDVLVLFIAPDFKLSGRAKECDKQSGGLLTAALKSSRGFKGEAGQSLTLSLPPATKFETTILIGVGKTENRSPLKAEESGGKLAEALAEIRPKSTILAADSLPQGKKQKEDDFLAHCALGALLRGYTFDKYKTGKKDGDKKRLAGITVETQNPAAFKKRFTLLKAEADGVILARDLVNEPPNAILPAAFAKRIEDELKPLGAKVEILDERAMAKIGMGALLAVGMGSENPPRTVIMEWNGTGKTGGKKVPLALVGKGVTFDTGGISIKPAAGMEEMKLDMGGAAAVIGTMKALAARKAKVHVIGIVGLVENMPSGKAYRPSDIIASLSGKTIEVLNTDAEGRLILADILTYIKKRAIPGKFFVLATLTGAMMIALGHEYCGTFVNADALWGHLESASRASGEKLWRMPLDDVWKKEMEGSISDLQNMGKNARFAGACTAAGFLEHFIEDGRSWAHLDIAGTAWIKKDRATVTKFGTGFGVRLLNQMIAAQYDG